MIIWTSVVAVVVGLTIGHLFSFASRWLDVMEEDAASKNRAREEAQHHVVRVWAERLGEVSWRCSCGFVAKHQRFDSTLGVDVPRCPGAEETDAEMALQPPSRGGYESKPDPPSSLPVVDDGPAPGARRPP